MTSINWLININAGSILLKSPLFDFCFFHLCVDKDAQTIRTHSSQRVGEMYMYNTFRILLFLCAGEKAKYCCVEEKHANCHDTKLFYS